MGEDGPGDGAERPAASAGLFAVFAGQGVCGEPGCTGDGGPSWGKVGGTGATGTVKREVRSRTQGVAGGRGKQQEAIV